MSKIVEWVCRRLRLARETQQLTLADVGEQMGIQRASVSSIELYRKEPKLSSLERYAEVLGIEMPILFVHLPRSDGTRWLPDAKEGARIARRLRVAESNSKMYWMPGYAGPWSLADELVWLNELVKLDWGLQASQQAQRCVEAAQREPSRGMAK